MPYKITGPVCCLLFTGTCLIQAREFCIGVDKNQYYCEIGFCCGVTECCTYYYELWWFWLVWTLIIMLSCCCAYRHRRVKLRLQQEQRQREISLMAYQGASSSFITPLPLNLRFWTDLNLPDYDEVAGHPPTPPPPYCEPSPVTLPGFLSSQSEAVLVPEPCLGMEPEGVGTDDPQARVGSPAQTEQHVEEEEPASRRRRVTGDSGIEVCVCQLGTDEDEEGGDQDEAQGSLCRASGEACCSERRTTMQKDLLPAGFHGDDSLVEAGQPWGTGQ